MIKIRPYCREFLKKMKEHYEIIIFTASTAGYAETIIKELDPQRKYISYILDRNFCLETKNGFYIKDLRIIKNRQLKNMIIVDNLVHSFGFQIDNGIPILEWTGNKQDEELRYLMDYLIEAKKYDDVREYNKEKLKLVELANSNIDEFLLDI
jgi:TFIIF-interacting CTD phosphatases, including NLI-interacting factor